MRYQCGIADAGGRLQAICRDEEDWMIARIANIAVAVAALMVSLSASAHAQDVPGIEICTVEKTMERRTSCLQSNVDFLQKTITKLSVDHQQKIDAANRQIEALKATVSSLPKSLQELQAQKKAADNVAQPAKDGPPP